MIYIHNKIGFWGVNFILPDSYKIGTTIEEYCEGAYLLLDDEQVLFHDQNMNATPEEVWLMRIDDPMPGYIPNNTPLAIAKDGKLKEIEELDRFSEKFFISVKQGGIDIANYEMPWINRSLRTSLLNTTIPALLSDGKTTKVFWTNTTPPVEVYAPIDWMAFNLPVLELYATRTYELSESNRIKVKASTTVEKVQDIDIYKDFPKFLTFELNLDL